MIEELGRYKIIGLIAEGGMSSVYEAVHTGLDTTVALKVLKPSISRNSDLIRKIWGGMEGEIHHDFSHRNVVKIYEFGLKGEHYFVSMELIPGERLDKYLDHVKLSQEEKGTIAGQILSGAHYVHQKKILHRDLCPKNVLVTEDDGLIMVKIIDFGVAIPIRVARELHDRGLRDRAGTSGYMSPEQARGDLNDQRTDVYGLGATLYRIETGKRPFKDFSPGHAGRDDAAYRFDVMTTVSQFTPMLPSVINPDVGPEVEAVIMKALERDPEKRYQSAQHVLRDLRRIGYVPKDFNPERRHEPHRPGGGVAVSYRLEGRGRLIRRRGKVRDRSGEFIAFFTSENPPRMGNTITVTLGQDTTHAHVIRVHPVSGGYDVVVRLSGN